ncbi:hypothetical protein HDU93_009549 [Gonapodya sp. JEL0774]|nr:hypothetical protein HDU93_009549 [Gonapodya sp. JEL0774]
MGSVTSVAAVRNALSGSRYLVQNNEELEHYEYLAKHILERFPNATRLEGSLLCPHMTDFGPESLTGWISEHRRHSILTPSDSLTWSQQPPVESLKLINALDVFPNIRDLGTLNLATPTNVFPYILAHGQTSPPVLRPHVRVLRFRYRTRAAFHPCKQSKVVEETLWLLDQFPALDCLTVEVALFRHGRSASLAPGLFLTTLIKKMTTTAARIEVHIENAHGHPLEEHLEYNQWKFDIVRGLSSWPKVLKEWDGTGKAVVVAGKVRILR